MRRERLKRRSLVRCAVASSRSFDRDDSDIPVRRARCIYDPSPQPARRDDRREDGNRGRAVGVDGPVFP